LQGECFKVAFVLKEGFFSFLSLLPLGLGQKGTKKKNGDCKYKGKSAKFGIIDNYRNTLKNHECG